MACTNVLWSGGNTVTIVRTTMSGHLDYGRFPPTGNSRRAGAGSRQRQCCTPKTYRRFERAFQIGRLLALAGFYLMAGSLRAAAESQRVDQGWEFHRGGLGSIWEVWRDKSVASISDQVHWTPVTLPHCFNARDAVDPDVPLYQGPGWYRTRLKLANPLSRRPDAAALRRRRAKIRSFRGHEKSRRTHRRL